MLQTRVDMFGLSLNCAVFATDLVVTIHVLLPCHIEDNALLGLQFLALGIGQNWAAEVITNSKVYTFLGVGRCFRAVIIISMLDYIENHPIWERTW